MPYQITMPQLSDTMTEGTIVKWLKQEGDAVKAGQIVAEVETDKATMEMESFESGTLAQIVISEGQMAAVGDTIAIVAKDGESVEKAAGSGEIAKGSVDKPATSAKVSLDATDSTGGSDSTSTAGTSTIESSADRHSDAATEIPANGRHQTGGDGTGGRVKASPLARRIAANNNIDIATLTGSGPNGRIVQADVLAAGPGADRSLTEDASKNRSTSSTQSAATGGKGSQSSVASGQTEKIVLNKMRQTIANRLQLSKQNIPHFYETIEIDMSAAASLRAKLVEAYEKKEGIRVSIGDVIAKAVASALRAVPQMNSTYDDKTFTVTRFGDVNLGMAVALPDGLIVPVLRNIDKMTFKEIRQRSADLVDRARQQKLKREEMSGATFTVSNLGLMGIKEFSAIVNPPEVGILAIGASEDRVVARGGQIVIRPMMSVTLSCDHRVIDGAVAAKFLATLKGYLEEPAMMFV